MRKVMILGLLCLAGPAMAGDVAVVRDWSHPIIWYKGGIAMHGPIYMTMAATERGVTATSAATATAPASHVVRALPVGADRSQILALRDQLQREAESRGLR